MKFTFHILGLPQTWTSKVHCACAYTQKIYNFCKMMGRRGHTITHYGCEVSEPPNAKHVQVMSLAEQEGFFGTFDKEKLFNPAGAWSASSPWWRLFNARAVAALSGRVNKGDIILVNAPHKPVADWFPHIPAVEFGIGYFGTFSYFRVFESYAHLNLTRGSEQSNPDGSPYDVAIPNYYDPDDFPIIRDPFRDGPYFLFVGRLIQRKGIDIAVEVTKRIGAKLIVAGQGDYRPDGEHVTYGGHASEQARNRLMAGATATFVPTQYFEPFGGVSIESMLNGTPVITTDWGVFPETIEHGVTGWRCRTIEHFEWAAKNVDKLAPSGIIRDKAVSRFSFDRVAPMYEEYFQMVQESGVQEGLPRTNLDWLRT